mgnify:CR=1 FL=1
MARRRFKALNLGAARQGSWPKATDRHTQVYNQTPGTAPHTLESRMIGVASSARSTAPGLFSVIYFPISPRGAEREPYSRPRPGTIVPMTSQHNRHPDLRPYDAQYDRIEIQVPHPWSSGYFARSAQLGSPPPISEPAEQALRPPVSPPQYSAIPPQTLGNPQ